MIVAYRRFGLERGDEIFFPVVEFFRRRAGFDDAELEIFDAVLANRPAEVRIRPCVFLEPFFDRARRLSRRPTQAVYPAVRAYTASFVCRERRNHAEQGESFCRSDGA